MSIRHDERAGSSVARVLTSVPWFVVLLGVSLLTVLLLVVLFSLRGPERQSAPPPAPPIYLPTVGATTTSAAPTDAPLVAVGPTASPTASASGTPSPRASSARPPASAPARPAAPRAGALTARYQATASGRDYFEARLTVGNGSAGSQSWEVELTFAGNVKSIDASSGSGLSVSSQGNGWFVLRGTGPLGSGESAVVQMRFSRTGSGDRPGQCTVNDADCVIG
ncbi:hypothetical protein [Micromonospora inositola]|uniref:Cellulose binding domain-containing protein n=1 Tax=Micromonospora inositola TaxID=47865 RepID=A0A1C5J226_9ACTN|nr:hypothetical protein [Micromonospora inositola]SCG64642.1 hypothetical protein GA0070613_3873 [Micromonospora inositola]